jgi:hypothetical protein
LLNYYLLSLERRENRQINFDVKKNFFVFGKGETEMMGSVWSFLGW